MNWIVKIGRELVQALTDPYRPELHYMRGPGPKWRAKNTPRGRPTERHSSTCKTPLDWAPGYPGARP